MLTNTTYIFTLDQGRPPSRGAAGAQEHKEERNDQLSQSKKNYN